MFKKGSKRGKRAKKDSKEVNKEGHGGRKGVEKLRNWGKSPCLELLVREGHVLTG